MASGNVWMCTGIRGMWVMLSGTAKVLGVSRPIEAWPGPRLRVVG